MNHQLMIEEIGDIALIRPIYESLKDLLRGDAHHRLQRGSLEVEHGSLDLAENYLNQARNLAMDDYLVQTEYAYMNLKRAGRTLRPEERGWKERAESAFADLDDAIRHRVGAADSYPYHILGSQGLSFVRRAPLSSADKAQLLSELVRQLKAAVVEHPGVAELIKLRDDLEHEYLSLAVRR